MTSARLVLRSLSYTSILLLLAVVFLQDVAGQAPNAHTQEAYRKAVRESAALIQERMSEGNIPGMSAAVLVDGEIVWAQGFGFADLENRTPLTTQTKMRIGSVSKPISGVGMMMLVDAGQLDLDADARSYVPQFPEKAHVFTTRQLAGHLAGIRHYNGTEFLSDEYYSNVRSGLKIFEESPLLFEPGTKYSYSSYGWNLLSAVMEAASGESFLPFMQANVFDPLNLTSTMPEYMDRLIPYRTRYYNRTPDGTILNAPYVDNSYKWAGGGFISTASDVVRFGYHVAFTDLFQASTREEMFATQHLADGRATNYGLGWGSGEDGSGRRWVGHGGGSVGGTTQFKIFPDDGVVVCVIANLGGAGYGNLDLELADLFIQAKMAH